MRSDCEGSMECMVGYNVVVLVAITSSNQSFNQSINQSINQSNDPSSNQFLPFVVSSFTLYFPCKSCYLPHQTFRISSFHPSIHPSVRPSIHPSVHLFINTISSSSSSPFNHLSIHAFNQVRRFLTAIKIRTVGSGWIYLGFMDVKIDGWMDK